MKKTVSLDTIARFGHGGTPSKSRQDYWTGKFPWVSSKDMHVTEIGNARDKISELALKETNVGRASAGSILIVNRSGILARKVPIALVTGDLAFNQDIKGVFPNPELVDSSYLRHYLISQQSWILSNGVKQGSTVHSIKAGFIEKLVIPLPPLPQQRKIAATLDSQLSFIDEARQAAERRVKAAADMESALFREFFHGITPVVIGTPKDAAPAGWAWQRLTKLAVLESGHTPSRKHPEWWGGEIPWIALPDIRALDGKVAMETKNFTNSEGIANSSARILPKDTVVFGRDVQVGFTSIMGRPMATSQHFFNWVCGKNLAPRFLMHALRASKTYMESMSSGAIHQTIYMPAAREFHLCLPDRKRQDKLTAHLDSQLADAATLLAAARAELASIQALPAAVLRRIFDA